MQKNLRSTEIKVGIITFSAILLAIIGISLGRGMTVAPAGKVMSIRFTNANGIEPSSPVWINGFKRGSVLTVKPDNGSVLVTASLDNYDDIKQDVSARVTILELTGGKKIEIMPGVSAATWNGNEIKGTTVPDFGELLAVVGDMGTDAKVLIRRLDTISAHLNVLMADGTFINNVKQMTSDASKTVADIRALVEANKQNLNVAIVNMRTLSDDLKRLVTDNEPAVNSIIKKLDATATSAERVLKSADGTLARVDTLVANVDAVVHDVRYGDGSVHKLLYDKNLATKLDSAMSNLQIFVDQVSKHGVNVNLRLGTRP